MATEITEEVLPAGIKALQVLQFNFPQWNNTDAAVRKGTFTLKMRSGILQNDGGSREDLNPIKLLSESQTKLLLEDTVTLASGKEITGAEIAEGLGIAIDKAWAGDYDVVDEEPEEPEV